MDSRPWLKNYPKGLPANIDVDKYPNLNIFLTEARKSLLLNRRSIVWGNH